MQTAVQGFKVQKHVLNEVKDLAVMIRSFEAQDARARTLNA
jgi:hypothetical protein